MRVVFGDVNESSFESWLLTNSVVVVSWLMVVTVFWLVS